MPHATAQSTMRDRLTHTPMRDLIRGRVTGRLDFNARIAQVGLNPKAEALVKQTVRRTRLWRLEKAQVADELIAHFRDATSATPPIENPAEDFGDPAAAAKLIRRAKIRQRPLAVRAATWSLRIAVVLIAIYLLIAARFFLRTPSIHTNYVQALATAMPSVPPDQQAWTLYREAWTAANLADLDYQAAFCVLNEHGDYTHDPDPQKIKAFIAAHPGLIDTLRSAAARPALGYPVFDSAALTAADRTALYGAKAHQQPTHHDHTTPFDEAFDDQHASLLLLSRRLLFLDSLAALDDSNPDSNRVYADLQAILQQSNQVTTVPDQRGSMSNYLLAAALDMTQSVLAQHRQLLTDTHLANLKRQLAATDPRQRVDLETMRLIAYDTLQRLYDDDGHGDGRITREGILQAGIWQGCADDRPAFTRLLNATDWIPGVTNSALPALQLRYPTRLQLREQVDQLFDRYEASLTGPLRGDPAAGRQLEFNGDGLRERFELLALQAVLDIDPSDVLPPAEKTVGRRDGTVLAIACEQYRRTHGVWPAELGALAPDFIDQVPTDLITGGPLHYVIRDDQPRIYSVGIDRDDDGGAPPIDGNGEPASWLASTWDPSDRNDPTRNGDWILYPQPTAN